METLIILCIISVALNIAIYPLCKINYRIEDAERLAEGKINVKCQVMHFPKACWIITGIFLIIAILAHNDMAAVMILIGIDCLVAFFLCLAAVFQRNSYYTVDEERLTYVKHGIEEWSHTWDEIDHARKRIISTGKSFIILYDIETKDGVKHRALPSVLGRDLRDHVRMDNRIKPVAICVLIILLFIVATLIILGIFNS